MIVLGKNVTTIQACIACAPAQTVRGGADFVTAPTTVRAKSAAEMASSVKDKDTK
jgi:hypothetical protein